MRLSSIYHTAVLALIAFTHLSFFIITKADSTSSSSTTRMSGQKKRGEAINCIENTSGSRLATEDPFLFAVYHQDHYPAGDDKMQAPRMGNGADFNASAPYRVRFFCDFDDEPFSSSLSLLSIAHLFSN